MRRIRFIINILTPDNYIKLLKELKEIMFGECKTIYECTHQNINYDPYVHKLGENQIREEIVNVFAQTIYKNMSMRKDFCLFYGEILQMIVIYELHL